MPAGDHERNMRLLTARGLSWSFRGPPRCQPRLAQTWRWREEA